MTALYQLADSFRETAAKLADMDLPAEVVADTLEGLAGEFEAKAEGVIAFTRNLESTAAAIKDAERQMKARRESYERRAAQLRDYVRVHMERTGIKAIECPLFKLRVQANPERVVIFDAAQIPAQFLRQPEPPPPPPPEPDLERIRAAIRDHNERKAAAERLGVPFNEPDPVPGARLERGSRLVIA